MRLTLGAIHTGYFVPKVKDSLSVVQLDTVSLPLALGLWGMMLPVLAKVTAPEVFRGFEK